MDNDVVGYDLNGNEITEDMVRGDLMGVGRAPQHRLARIPNRPQWRSGQLAPGVQQPAEGRVPLTLSGQSNSGLFSAAFPVITFSGQLQKPFRAERLLTSVVRTGASAVGRLLTVLYVGTDLQQAEITGWDAELVGLANATDTGMQCIAAEPGVLIRAVITLSQVLTGTDTIFANLTFMGKIIH